MTNKLARGAPNAPPLAQTAIRRDSSLLHFSEAIRFLVPVLLDEFDCRTPPFSTLSTPSTVLVPNSRETSLIWRYLAPCRFWYAICF